MAFKNGRLLTCERCGKEVFLLCIGEAELDGGFTRWNKFEKPPEGWRCFWRTGDLCPECSKLYHELLKNFMTEVKDNGFREERKDDGTVDC